MNAAESNMDFSERGQSLEYGFSERIQSAEYRYLDIRVVPLVWNANNRF